MSRHAPRIGSTLGLVALAFGILSAIGWLSRKELDHTTSGIQSYIPATLELLHSCEVNHHLDPLVQRSLLVYLTIEMRMRSTAWREIEFVVARAGAELGFQPIRTIGVGQIALASFTAHHYAGSPASQSPSLSVWVNDLRNHCKNVEILAWIIGQHNETCPEAKFGCVLSAACRLHSADSSACLSQPQFLKYRMAVAAIYAQIVSWQETVGH